VLLTDPVVHLHSICELQRDCHFRTLVSCSFQVPLPFPMTYTSRLRGWQPLPAPSKVLSTPFLFYQWTLPTLGGIFKGDGDAFPFPLSTSTDRITRSHASALHTAVVWSLSISFWLSLTSYVTLPRPLFDSWFSMPSIPKLPKKWRKYYLKKTKTLLLPFAFRLCLRALSYVHLRFFP